MRISSFLLFLSLIGGAARADESAVLNDLSVRHCSFDGRSEVFSFLPDTDGTLSVIGLDATSVTVSGDTTTVVDGTRILQFRPDRVTILDGSTLIEADCADITLPVTTLLGRIVSPDIGGDIGLMLENQRKDIARMEFEVARAERERDSANRARTAADLARAALETRVQRLDDRLVARAEEIRLLKSDRDALFRRVSTLRAEVDDLRERFNVPPDPKPKSGGGCFGDLCDE